MCVASLKTRLKWFLLKLTFFKAYVVVDVHHFSSGHVNQHIVKVTVTKADDIPNH